MVPILDTGLFGAAETMHHRNLFQGGRMVGGGYFTYEVMKKLHPIDSLFYEKQGAVQAGLKDAGYRHIDAHQGNIMENTDGEPQAIDLESIKTLGKVAIKEREIDPNKPVIPGRKLDKGALGAGPMPGSQGNLREAAHRKLPRGVQRIEIKDQGRGGNKESKYTTVDHVTEDGTPKPAHRENNTASVLGVNLAEATKLGRPHSVSARAPGDGAKQSAATPEPEQPKGTTT